MKIYNGHQDSVVAVDFCVKSKQFVSASYDKSCKGTLYVSTIILTRSQCRHSITPMYVALCSSLGSRQEDLLPNLQASVEGGSGGAE